MKKLFALVLAAAMVFALCSCTIHIGGEVTPIEDNSQSQSGTNSKGGTTSEKTQSDKTSSTASGTTSDKPTSTPTSSTTSETPPVSTDEWNFDNTYYKLTHDKELTIAYIGGSVTVGTGDGNHGWRERMTNWFKKQYPEAKITEVNAAIGGSSSVWSAPRYKTAILDKKPDLVFLELTINDYYAGASAGNGGLPKENESAMYLDYIIRRTQKDLPNCDIVFVSVVDGDTVVNGCVNAKGQKAVCEYEGVPFLDMTEPMFQKIGGAKKTLWSKYYTDSVHPSAEGYDAYAQYIQMFMLEKLKDSKIMAPDSLTPHTVKAKAYTDFVPTDIEIVRAQSLNFGTGWTKVTTSSAAKFGTDAVKGSQGAKFTYEFKGTSIGMPCNAQNGANITVTIDGANAKKIAANAAAGEVLLYSDLDPTKTHKLEITVGGDKTFEIFCFTVGKK